MLKNLQVLPRSKNILLLVPTFADAGGTQKMVCELGKLLSERYNVYECSFDAFNEPHIFKNGNPVLSLNIPDSSKLLSKLKGYILKAYRLHKLKKKYKVDITISNLWAADMVNILSLGRGKRVSVCHGSIRGFAGNKLLLKARRFASLIYRRFHKVIAVNQHLREELLDIFSLDRCNTIYINNFVSFPVKTQQTKIQSMHKLRLVTLGRLDPLKNLDALLGIIALVKKNIAVQLLVIGSGPALSHLTALASELGLTTSEDPENYFTDIVFAGFNSQPISLLESCDLFVFPTKSEGLPLVLIEAMYAGLPIISSDCPTGGPHMLMQGSGEYKEGRKEPEETTYGYLMPIPDLNNTDTLDIWQTTIIKLWGDGKKRKQMAENAQERANHFSRESIKHYWFDMIDKL